MVCLLSKGPPHTHTHTQFSGLYPLCIPLLSAKTKQKKKQEKKNWAIWRLFTGSCFPLFVFTKLLSGSAGALCGGPMCVCTAAGLGIFPRPPSHCLLTKAKSQELKFLQLQANYKTQTITSWLLWFPGWRTAEYRMKKRERERWREKLFLSNYDYVCYRPPPPEKEGSQCLTCPHTERYSDIQGLPLLLTSLIHADLMCGLWGFSVLPQIVPKLDSNREMLGLTWQSDSWKWDLIFLTSQLTLILE